MIVKIQPQYSANKLDLTVVSEQEIRVNGVVYDLSQHVIRDLTLPEFMPPQVTSVEEFGNGYVVKVALPYESDKAPAPETINVSAGYNLRS